MFGYAPQVTDRSGELQAAGQLKGAEGIASGIQSVGQSIGGALETMGKYKMAADQADATAGVIQKMGMFNSESDPDGSKALAMIQATPWQQKATLGPSLVQLVGTQALMKYHADDNAIRRAALNAKDVGGAESKITSF
jgi:hypothetical protein